MAEDQKLTAGSARRSPLDDLPPPLAREVAAAQAAQAKIQSFNTAVDFLERVFLRASTNDYGARRLVQWIDPAINEHKFVSVRDSVISDVLQKGPIYKDTLAAKREYYKEQILNFVPVVEAAARRWALDDLSAQTLKVAQLLPAKPRAAELHKAARAIRATVDATKLRTIGGRSYSVPTFVLPTMTGDEAREVTGESRTGGTVATRLRRMFYMYALRSAPIVAKGATPLSAQAEAYKNLVMLMAHPRGVEIIDAFARSPEAGWDFTTGLMSDTFTAIGTLQRDLVTDETLVWRFPPAIAAGVASLGLRNRAGITQFALAWGASRKGLLEEVLEIAGNSLFVLDLVGGPLGSAVSDILNFVLATIGTAVSFLRDVEQDQAATATAFAERSQRLSQGSNKIGTFLQGFAAIATGLAVPGAVSKITGRKAAVLKVDAIGTMKDVPNPRGVTTNAVEGKAFDATERGLTGKGTEITQKKVGQELEYTAATEIKAATASATQPNKLLTDAETKYGEVLKASERKLVDVLTNKKIGMTTAEAEKIAANLRKSLPPTVPTSVAELRKTIEDIMDAATRQAWSEGLVNAGGGALGTRAHRYTEYLLDHLNVMLAKGKMKIGVLAEQFVSPVGPGDFLKPAGPPKDFKWILSERKKDWLGIDAVLYENGVAVLAIDLKTGSAWSKQELRILLERFGLKEEQLIQYHPNLFGR